MKIPRTTARRRAISGIIGGVILFTLLFTVGTEYFLFINSANNLENQSLMNRASTLDTRMQEAITITGALTSTGHFEFYFNDTGGVSVNVTAAILLSSSGAILECDGVGLPSGQSCTNTTPALPAVANPGSGAPQKGYFVMNAQYTSGTVTLKLVTVNGNVFTANYPLTPPSLANQALTSGALGDLYLTFDTWAWYNVQTSNCYNPYGQGYSSDCLAYGDGNNGTAFAIPSAYTNYNIGFAIELTNLNSEKADIVLDQYTLVFLNSFYGKTHQDQIPWYIASVGPASGGHIPIYSDYTPYVLHYDVPTWVYFISSTCVIDASGSGPQYDWYCNNFSPQSNQYNSGQVATVFILSNGWKYAAGSYTLTQGYSNSLVYYGYGLSPNYGQNSPFVSSLFY